MARMVEEAVMVLLLLIQIKLVFASRDNHRQINHLVMALFLIVWRVGDPVLFVICVIKLAAPELREHMLETDAIESDASNLDFESLAGTEISRLVDLLIEVLLEQELSTSAGHLHVVLCFLSVVLRNDERTEKGCDRLH